MNYFKEITGIDIKYRIPKSFCADAVEGYLESILHNLISNTMNFLAAESTMHQSEIHNILVTYEVFLEYPLQRDCEKI